MARALPGGPRTQVWGTPTFAPERRLLAQTVSLRGRGRDGAAPASVRLQGEHAGRHGRSLLQVAFRIPYGRLIACVFLNSQC